MWRLGGCLKCGGALEQREPGEWHCLQCGYIKFDEVVTLPLVLGTEPLQDRTPRKPVLQDKKPGRSSKAKQARPKGLPSQKLKPFDATTQDYSVWVISQVSAHYGLKKADVLSEQRLPALVLARDIIIYVLYLSDEYSAEQIGRFLGRTASSVYYGANKVSNLISRQPYLEKLIDRLLDRR